MENERNTAFAARLIEAINESGVPDSQSALGQLFGVSGVMVWSYRNGEKLPRMNTALRIASALGVNVEWLLTGSGPKHSKPASLRENGASYNLGSDTNSEKAMSRVPCISWIQAGSWGEVVDNFQPGDGFEWIETTVPIKKHTFALKVTGDSMEPIFPHGCFIIVEPEIEWQNRDFVVVRQSMNAECTFKQIIKEGDQILLKPLNSRYPIMELKADAVICGVVRSMEMRFR